MILHMTLYMNKRLLLNFPHVISSQIHCERVGMLANSGHYSM